MTQLYKYCTLILLSLLIFSCKGQSNKGNHNANTKTKAPNSTETKIPLPENGFYCGLLDKKGNLWLGSRGNGVYKIHGDTFTNYNKNNGLCSDDISCIAEDKMGHLWFGTPDGVCKFDGQNFESLKIPQSDTSSVWLDKVYPIVNPNQVMSILEDKDGDLWFGTNGAGVYQYDGKSFKQHLSKIGKTYEDGQQHNIVLSIVEDTNGYLWFTSLSHGGVSVYVGQEFKHYRDELSDDFVRTVYCDRKGNIWIGTHGNHNGGLDRYDGKVFTTFYKTDDGLPTNNVRCIFEDDKGEFWIGSGNSPLSIFDGQHFRTFEGNQGQEYDRIIFILQDAEHHIWFGNKNGLWKYNGQQVIKMTQS